MAERDQSERARMMEEGYTGREERQRNDEMEGEHKKESEGGGGVIMDGNKRQKSMNKEEAKG